MSTAMSLELNSLNFLDKYEDGGDHSRTSTLSSGYESGFIDSDYEDILGPLKDSAKPPPDYFVLEDDERLTANDKVDCKLQKVKESMMNIITDLQSLGFETNMEDLTQAVKNSATKSTACSRKSSDRKSRRPKKLPISQPNADPFESRRPKRLPISQRNADPFEISPVDDLFKEVQHNSMNKQSNERLYDRLISNLAMDCLKNEPIYEEIDDDCEFDDVLHSDTYRRYQQSSLESPPPLPPRHKPNPNLNGTFFLDLTQGPTQQNNLQNSSHSLTEVEKVKYNREGRPSSWTHYPTTR